MKCKLCDGWRVGLDPVVRAADRSHRWLDGSSRRRVARHSLLHDVVFNRRDSVVPRTQMVRMDPGLRTGPDSSRGTMARVPTGRHLILQAVPVDLDQGRERMATGRTALPDSTVRDPMALVPMATILTVTGRTVTGRTVLEVTVLEVTVREVTDREAMVLIGRVASHRARRNGMIQDRMPTPSLPPDLPTRHFSPVGSQ